MDEKEPMIKAIIDLGTNTFNLLIAQVNSGGIEELHSEKEGVAIGMGGINDGKITLEAMDRALKALSHFKKVCKEYKVDHLWAFGTSAIRDASNQVEFVERVEKELGLRIEVLSGDQEAALIFEGVKGLPGLPKEAVILDIGGGSSEVIEIHDGQLDKAKSLDIGVSRIYQKFEFSDPLTSEDIQKIERYLETNSKAFTPWPSQEILIGSSGSFETLYELIFDKVFPHDPEFYELPQEAFLDQLERMIGSTLLERKADNRIMPIRQVMLHITAVKIRWFVRKTGVTKVLVAPYSMKEGALLSH